MPAASISVGRPDVVGFEQAALWHRHDDNETLEATRK
jgi:hypothetical protein